MNLNQLDDDDDNDNGDPTRDELNYQTMLVLLITAGLAIGLWGRPVVVIGLILGGLGIIIWIRTQP